MFDVGFTEILLIGIVALVVIGPERLPAVAKTAGQWIGKLQRFVRGVKTDLASELQSGDLKKLIGDQREQINELKSMVSAAKKDFETNSRDVVQSAKKSLGELESSVKELDGAVAGKENSAIGSASDKLQSTASTEAPPQSSDNSSGVDASIESSSVGGNSDAVDVSTTPQLSKSPPPGSGGESKTSSMRTDSSGSSNDSTDMNRTGTESGS